MNALFEIAGDKTTIVQDAINTSLKKIAQHYPNEVLISCSKFYEKNPKLSAENLYVILTPMESICRDHIVLIDGDTLLVLIDFCFDVMTKSGYDSNVQLSASSVLVALGSKHCVQVVN